jgi:hypothetical protein
MDDLALTTAALPDTKPKPRVYLERIGATEWELTEAKLDISDVALWSANPRLQTSMMGGVASELELESALRLTPGYDILRRSIDEIGQMEPVYVWRADETSKYIVFEGATRVSILRELNRKYESGPKQNKFRSVRAKILPAHFGELERAILLARIHVRGTGVRAWGRYIEAKFIFDTIEDKAGQPALMNATDMGRYMEKSLSWVTRLRDAYKFARKFVEYIDSDEAERLAGDNFSILEELSKAPVIGTQLREFDNQNLDGLRADVFEMVRNEAFKEYRDARFIKDFHDDPDKWEQLKSGEKHIASRLAMDVKTNAGSIKTKLSAVDQQVQRAIDRKEIQFDDDDVESLQRAIVRIQEQIHPGVRPFRVELMNTTKMLSEASMADVKALSPQDLSDFKEAHEYFAELVSKHWKE